MIVEPSPKETIASKKQDVEEHNKLAVGTGPLKYLDAKLDKLLRTAGPIKLGFCTVAFVLLAVLLSWGLCVVLKNWLGWSEPLNRVAMYPLMDLIKFPAWLAGISAVLIVVAKREFASIVDFDVDAEFIAMISRATDPRDSDWLVELCATIHNRGKIRHEFAAETFTFNVRYLLPDGEVKDGPRGKRAGTCVKMESKILEPSAKTVEERKLGHWLGSDWGSTHIEPGVCQKYRTTVLVPANALALNISVQWLYFKNDWHNCGRTFKVPRIQGPVETA